MLLVRTSESAYRQASFLDDRFLAGDRESLWVPAAELYAAAALIDCARPLHFVFHTGHVGSTLVSRLLDGSIVVSLAEGQESGPRLSMRQWGNDGVIRPTF